MLLTFVDFFKSQPEAMITQWLLSSVLAKLHGNYVNRLRTAKPVNKRQLGTSAIERAKE